LGYWAVQLAGGVAGAFLLLAFFGSALVGGVTHPGPGVTPLAAFGWEATITTLLVFVILCTAAEKAVVGKNAALAVGFTVALAGLFSSPLTGASMNPARSFGPQVATGTWTGAWIYFAGPLAGAVAGAFLCSLLHVDNEGERKAAKG
jgi:aquaporin Z